MSFFFFKSPGIKPNILKMAYKALPDLVPASLSALAHPHLPSTSAASTGSSTFSVPGTVSYPSRSLHLTLPGMMSLSLLH